MEKSHGRTILKTTGLNDMEQSVKSFLAKVFANNFQDD
jgi:hypothetical protein